MANTDWTADEIRAAVDAYKSMLNKELAGEAFNKAEINRELRGGTLAQRSRGSIEMRMCNISAVLEANGKPYISGYKPRKNVGPRNTAMIEQALFDASNTVTSASSRRHLYDQLRKKIEEAGFIFETEQPCHHQNRIENELKFVHPALLVHLKNQGFSVRGQKFYLKPLSNEPNCEIGFVNGTTSALIDHPALPSPNATDVFKDTPAWVNRPEDASIDELLLQIADIVGINIFASPNGLLREAAKEQTGTTDPPARVPSTGFSFKRSAAVKSHVKSLANGFCELCDQPAPFAKVNGEPYLEVHHVIPLENDGIDHVSNAVAVCPNCHMRCHHSADSEEITDSLYKKISRLSRS